jgi:hypothetical protein
LSSVLFCLLTVTVVLDERNSVANDRCGCSACGRVGLGAGCQGIALEESTWTLEGGLLWANSAANLGPWVVSEHLGRLNEMENWSSFPSKLTFHEHFCSRSGDASARGLL